MPSDANASRLRKRARALTDLELDQIPWLKGLTAEESARAKADLIVTQAQSGDYICRIGRPVTYWFGLIEGLLKMSNDDSLGPQVTFTGVAPGGWFGEGTALKHEQYRYNIQALRQSLVAGIPIETFDWLLDHSLGFNRFVMRQLNERLGQFIAAREIDRINLAALFHPLLSPNVGGILRTTQQELAYLVGLSRQRVNEALTMLAAKGWIRVEYGGVRVLDLQALRSGQL
jgi:CRP/FNR family transcriptional regulator, cyclic AMP receptor protein